MDNVTHSTEGDSQQFNTVEEKHRDQFNQFSIPERQIFLAKLLHAIHHDDTAIMYAIAIVEGAEAKGLFDGMKFGMEIEPQKIGHQAELS